MPPPWGTSFRWIASSPALLAKHGRAMNAETCWPMGANIHPMMCCVGPSAPACGTDDLVTACCRREILSSGVWRQGLDDSVEVPPPPRLDLSGVRKKQLRNFSVDLIVRSFALEAPMLRPFFESLEMYWPRWGEVVLVLDAESGRDRALCDQNDGGNGQHVPVWVRCVFEPLPALYKYFLPVWNDRDDGRGISASKGKVRAMWSLFWADRYCNAEHIAIVDADVVLVSFGARQVLFATDRLGSKPKPVFYGAAEAYAHMLHPSDRWPGNEILNFSAGVTWGAGFPVLVRREHLSRLRAYIDERMGALGDFDLAFVALMRQCRTRADARESNTFLPWFHEVVAKYLYKRHRSQYSWSIQNGLLRGFPTSHSCPSLILFRHMHECGGKVGKSNKLSESQYSLSAWRFMQSGMCAIPRYRTAAEAPKGAERLTTCPSRHWCELNNIPNVSAVLYGTTDFGAPEFCMRWLPRRISLMRPLTRRCGHRSVDNLIFAYKRLLARSYACVP